MWWAYLHTSGSIHVKRYYTHKDLEDARESPFVRNFMGPFEAASRLDAVKVAQQAFDHIEWKE